MQVMGSPFHVMNVLAKEFGYTLDVCPIEGIKQGKTKIIKQKTAFMRQYHEI